LHVTGGTNYGWSPAGDLSNASVSNPTANPLSTTTYHVTVADNIGCEANDSMIVFVNPLPVPVVSNDTAICFGTAASLHASGGTNYSWSPGTGLSNPFISNPQSNPSSTTTYHVTVADNIGCSSVDSVTVFVNPLPQPLLSADTAICKGTIASLTASGGVFYQWSSGSSGNHIDVSPLISTTYSVSVTDTNSCTASAIVNVTVDPLEITLYGDHDICIGESTQIQASGANIYLWNTGSQQPFIVVEPQTDSVFTVVGNDGLCADTSIFSVIVHQQPAADAGPDLSIILNDEVTLEASGGVSCTWSPLDGLSCTDCCDPVASPHDTTIYKVIVTDVYGCSAIDSLLIIVIPPDDIFFPDAFTPNGDGLNDEFFPILSGHTQMQLLRVFNRWGELVFLSKEPSSGWDGTFQGKPESMGAYVYSFTGINTVNGKTVSKKGSVTIIR
jgi:gliding motility-associated-like protein